MTYFQVSNNALFAAIYSSFGFSDRDLSRMETLSQKKAGEEAHHIDLTKGPWLRLFGIGVVLMGVGLVFFNVMDGEKPGGVYQPPIFQDGKVIPGHIIRDE